MDGRFPLFPVVRFIVSGMPGLWPVEMRTIIQMTRQNALSEARVIMAVFRGVPGGYKALCGKSRFA